MRLLRSLFALGFHHIDATSKRFIIAGSHLRSWDALTDELRNCRLLCHNSHADTHDAENHAHLSSRAPVNAP